MYVYWMFKTHPTFSSTYLHTFPSCGSVLVLDGNMKHRRDVCYAKDAGIIQFDGLPGSIKTGCPAATPAFKCRYCIQHKIQACELVNFEDYQETNLLPSANYK